MCIMALRCWPSRLLSSFMSPMMWRSAQRRSSPRRTRCSSPFTCSRRRAWVSRRPSTLVSAGDSSADSGTVTLAPVHLHALELLAEGLHLLLQGNHLELATHDHLLELLEVEDLLLQLPLRGPEVAHDALVGTHVAQDADGADHLAVEVPQRRGVERRRDDLPGGAARIQARVQI